MTEEVKKEHFSSHADGVLERVDKHNSGTPEEMTVTKTEVKEESYDEEAIGFECVLLPENGMYFTGKTEAEERFGEHLDSDKSNKDWFVCSVCKKEIFGKKSYARHTELCARTNFRLDAFGCNKCGYVTRLRGQLKQHARIHSNEKPFKCTYEGRDRAPCGYATVRRNNLRVHVLLRHSDEKKKYACKRCGYSTHIRGYLSTHMHTHANEKPFKCARCEYATTRKDTLRTHALLKHSDKEKRFRCRDCEYSTHLKGNLARHVQVHAHKKRLIICV